MSLCQCGCGKETLLIKQNYSKKGYIKGEYHKFIVGHNARVYHPNTGKQLSKETRRKIGIKHKGKKYSLELKKRLSEIHKLRVKNNPSERERLKEMGTKVWANPENREKMSKIHRGKVYSKEHKINISNSLKITCNQEHIKLRCKANALKQWQDAKFYEKAMLRLKSEKYLSKLHEGRRNKVLPVIDTKIEIKIQNYLKELGVNFFTHQYIKNIEHGYQCDILIPSLNLVIECDGDYWHKYPIGREIDHIRTKELIENGFKVLRLWEFEIKKITINEFKEKLNF